MAKINKLLEKRLDLAEYEEMYGDLPPALLSKTSQSLEEEQAQASESEY